MKTCDKIMHYVKRNPGKSATEIAHAINENADVCAATLHRLSSHSRLSRYEGISSSNRKAWLYSYNEGLNGERFTLDGPWRTI